MSASEKIAYEEKVRGLLAAVRSGDESAFNALIETIAPELRKLSGYRMRGVPPGQTLQATALVNEAVIRLMTVRDRAGDRFPEGKTHLLALASRIMAFILAESARKKVKRPRLVSIDQTDGADEWMDSSRIPELVDWSQPDLDALIAFDDALDAVERSNEKLGRRRRQVVVMRIFGGMNFREIAEALGIDETAATRDFHGAMAHVRQLLKKS
jgi:RNA polymerase sigma factor (TIGR02999 family)